MAKITTQEQIDARFEAEEAKFAKRAEVALRVVGRRFGAFGDGRAYVRHAAKYSGEGWYWRALVRQANGVEGARLRASSTVYEEATA